MNFLDPFADKGPWFLRLAFASVYLYHGIAKVISIGADQGAYAMMVGKMGMPVPVFLLITFAEVSAGAGVLIGAFSSSIITRLAGLAAAPVMIGAIFMVHMKNGWSFLNNGVEFPVVMLLLALYFLIAGNLESEAQPAI